jgi:hypothetical protein
MLENGEIAIVGGVHNLETGKVDFMEDTLISDRASMMKSLK